MKYVLTLILMLIVMTLACKTETESYSINESNQSKTISKSQELNNNSNFSKILELCANTQNRVENNDCLSNELNKLNVELSKIYEFTLDELQKNYTDKDVTNLKVAQKFWFSYREANCVAERDTYGDGTDAPTVSLSCFLKLTNERIEEIQRIYGNK